jgi:hypothetical protein
MTTQKFNPSPTVDPTKKPPVLGKPGSPTVDPNKPILHVTTPEGAIQVARAEGEFRDKVALNMGSIERRPFLKLLSAAAVTTAIFGMRSSVDAQVVPLRGIIYYIDGQNRLLWNRHNGRADGSFRWAEPTNRQVGTGWDVKHIFSGGDGLIYYIDGQNRLLWNRHDGRADGSFRWAEPTNRQVGTGWDVKHIFAG